MLELTITPARGLEIVNASGSRAPPLFQGKQKAPQSRGYRRGGIKLLHSQQIYKDEYRRKQDIREPG